MNNDQYNRISLAYQFLTKRFNFHLDYEYNGFYRCYNSKNYGVEGEYLEVLKHFENLTLTDICTKDHIESQNFSEDYANSNLVIIEENRVCVHIELGIILFYYLIYKFELGINDFLNLMHNLKENYKGLIRSSDDERIFRMKIFLYDEFIPQFERIENFRLFLHLFAKTNSSLMYRNWDNEIEVDMYKIQEALQKIKIFTFQNIEL